jgi:hypothetical protein
MDKRPASPPSLTAEPPRFGRRASDRGFAAPTGLWFGRRAGDRKAKVRHSLPFAAQVAAQIAEHQPKAEAPQPYIGAPPIRSGLVKDLKA